MGAGRDATRGKVRDTATSGEACPFCGRDPFHYVDIGVGMEAVAVICCEAGIEHYERLRTGAPTATSERVEEIAEIIRDNILSRTEGGAKIDPEKAARAVLEHLAASPTSIPESGASDYSVFAFRQIPEQRYAALSPVWRDISTAPKDGTRFIFTNGTIVGVGQMLVGKYFAADSWQGDQNTEPTHWQPLPAPPSLEPKQNPLSRGAKGGG